MRFAFIFSAVAFVALTSASDAGPSALLRREVVAHAPGQDPQALPDSSEFHKAESHEMKGDEQVKVNWIFAAVPSGVPTRKPSALAPSNDSNSTNASSLFERRKEGEEFTLLGTLKLGVDRPADRIVLSSNQERLSATMKTVLANMAGVSPAEASVDLVVPTNLVELTDLGTAAQIAEVPTQSVPSLNLVRRERIQTHLPNRIDSDGPIQTDVTFIDKGQKSMAASSSQQIDCNFNVTFSGNHARADDFILKLQSLNANPEIGRSIIAAVQDYTKKGGEQPDMDWLREFWGRTSGAELLGHDYGDGWGAGWLDGWRTGWLDGSRDGWGKAWPDGWLKGWQAGAAYPR